MGPPRTVHVLRWTGISGLGATETEESRDIPSKYEMRWGVNEVETQRGDSRWQERRLRPEVWGGGAGQWPDGGWQACAGAREAVSRSRRMRGQSSGIWTSLDAAWDLLYCVFHPERNASSWGVQTPCRPGHHGTGARPRWSHALDAPQKRSTSKRTVTSTLSSSSTVFPAGAGPGCSADAP